MMQRKVSGLIMTNWIPMSFNRLILWGGPQGPRPTPPSASVWSDRGSDAHAGGRPTIRLIIVLFCALMPLCAQAPKEPLANLIQEGNHQAALAQIRAGADVNAAQPD